MIRSAAWRLSLPSVILVLAACALPPEDAAFVPVGDFTGFKPTDLLLGPDPINGIAWMSLNQADLRAHLPNRASTVMIERQNSDGSLSFASAAVTGAPGAYTVITDYLKFAAQSVDKGPQGAPGIARIGVGIRVRAQVVTSRAGLNLGSLLAVAGAAKSGDLTGTFSVDLLGVDAPASLSLPLGIEVSQGSVQALLSTINAVEGRLIDPDSTLRPLLLAWRDLRADERSKRIPTRPLSADAVVPTTANGVTSASAATPVSGNAPRTFEKAPAPAVAPVSAP